MERKHFNHKDEDNTEQLLNTQIKINVSMNEYHIHRIIINEKEFDFNCLYFKHRHHRIGEFELKYWHIDHDRYKASCRLIINFKYKTNACFYITQKIKDLNNVDGVYPMKLKSRNGKNYVYENVIYFGDFKNGKKDKIEIAIYALAFFVK